MGCCAEVCRARPACCDGTLGASWDLSCTSTADNVCTFPPGNDECFSTSPNEGAFEFVLEDDGVGGACTPASESCSGTKRANNTFAGSELTDPGYCCNARGVGIGGAGTIWFKFEAMHESARIHTCETVGSEIAVNSIIQVYEALDHSNDDHDHDEYASLGEIACNDESQCRRQADLCVMHLNVSETYYIKVGQQ